MWNNVINAWWPLLFYAATDAPRFRKGMIAMLCTCVATLGVTALVWYLERREWRMKGLDLGERRRRRVRAGNSEGMKGKQDEFVDREGADADADGQSGEKQAESRYSDGSGMRESIGSEVEAQQKEKEKSDSF